MNPRTPERFDDMGRGELAQQIEEPWYALLRNVHADAGGELVEDDPADLRRGLVELDDLVDPPRSSHRFGQP